MRGFNALSILIALTTALIVSTSHAQSNAPKNNNWAAQFGLSHLFPTSGQSPSSDLKPTSDGKLRSSSGIVVDRSCLNVFPEKELGVQILALAREGVACMYRHRAGPQAFVDLKNLGLFFTDKKKPPEVTCDKPLPDTALAIASHPQSPRHPYLYLSSLGNDRFKKQPRFFRGVIFHELLHNIAYGHHPDDIEVASACEECCFGDLAAGAGKTAACRICGGFYPDSAMEDPRYIADLLAWDPVFYGRILAEDAFRALKGDVRRKPELAAPITAFVRAIGSALTAEQVLELAQRIKDGDFAGAAKAAEALPSTGEPARLRFLIYRFLSSQSALNGDTKQQKFYADLAEQVRSHLRSTASVEPSH